MSLATRELKSLQVINRLEVGPIRLEPQRMIAPCKVIQGAKEDTVDLIYHFEEDVFDPDELTSRNLASMMADESLLKISMGNL